MEETIESNTVVVQRSYISREDIEEISDDEAEWSDDFETLGFSDFEPEAVDGEVETPVKLFNVSEAELKPLRCFCSPTDRRSGGRTAPLETGGEGLPALVGRLEVQQDDEVDEKWIENLELLTACLEEDRPSLDPGLHAAVIRIAFLGLNYDVALNQPRPTNKVRHIKSGVKFVLELLECGAGTVSELLGSGLVSVLWNLFQKEYMTIPSKLLILRAVDRTLDHPLGMTRFLERTGSGSMYHEFLEMLSRDEKTRTKFALSSVVNKVHLHELVLELNHQCFSLPDPAPELEQRLEAGFRELGHIYSNLNLSFSHPARYLPTSKQFDHKAELFNAPERSYFSVLRNLNVLDLMTAVLTAPVTSGSDNLTSSIHSLLQLWSASLPGNQPLQYNYIIYLYSVYPDTLFFLNEFLLKTLVFCSDLCFTSA